MKIHVVSNQPPNVLYQHLLHFVSYWLYRKKIKVPQSDRTLDVKEVYIIEIAIFIIATNNRYLVL